MAVTLGTWLKLNPSTIEAVPETGGVFEIANLVRTVLFTGRGEGNMRRRLEALGAIPANLPSSVGGYYVRYALVDDEEAALVELETAHRAAHAGRLPLGNEAPLRTPIRLVTRNAA